MKEMLIAAALLLSAVGAHAQDANAWKTFNAKSIPTYKGDVFYEDVIKVDSSFKKDALYDNAKMALVRLFRDSKSVIEIDDKENYHIVGKGILTFSYGLLLSTVESNIRAVCDISIKDGRYRLQVYSFSGNQITHSMSTAYSSGESFSETSINDYLAVALDPDKSGIAKKAALKYCIGFNKQVSDFMAAFERLMNDKDHISANNSGKSDNW